MSGGKKVSSLYFSLDKFECWNFSHGYIYLYDVVVTTNCQEVNDGPPASSVLKGSTLICFLNLVLVSGGTF